jgi:hypothetical protein
MVWDYKNVELKRFIQKEFSIKEEVPDTISEDGVPWVKTRRITSLYRNIKTNEKRVIDNDLYEFDFSERPGQIIIIGGEEWQWERNLSGFATITDFNGVLRRSHNMKFETKFTKPPLESDRMGYGLT